MRTWIYNRIKAVTGLPNGIADRVISSGAIGEGQPIPATPFMILNMGVEQPVPGITSKVKVQEIPFDVWIHDAPGSYLDNIDATAVALKDNLPTTAPAVSGGMSVYECRWEETSSDTTDDQLGTNTRRVSFRLITRR